uniref:HYLS1_C domain-containing protein n=1 Tax=Mesocestoides corti TaxID=53468 RepID=A0A5K3FLN7_MESCO
METSPPHNHTNVPATEPSNLQMSEESTASQADLDENRDTRDSNGTPDHPPRLPLSPPPPNAPLRRFQRAAMLVSRLPPRTIDQKSSELGKRGFAIRRLPSWYPRMAVPECHINRTRFNQATLAADRHSFRENADEKSQVFNRAAKSFYQSIDSAPERRWNKRTLPLVSDLV